MDLLILSEEQSNLPLGYRGTSRDSPYHVDELSDDHPVNRLFLWYCEEGGEAGVVHNLIKARELVDEYSRLKPPQYFEIVEVTKDQSNPTAGREFLGFDLSAGYGYSLLSWGLEIDNIRSDLLADAKLQRLHPLLRLAKEFFKPKLNSNGLLDNDDDAVFLLNCMLALQTIYPNLWENEDVTFEVVGLWKIR